MKAVQLKIQNFRGVKSALLHFDGHTLLLGHNNVGKSTICEALELVLGPDRLNKYPPVEEFDFYNAQYLDPKNSEPIPIQIEVVLIDLSEEVANKCAAHTQFWDRQQRKVLGEVNQVDGPNVAECLRLRAVAQYDPEEDQFQARVFFVDGPAKPNGDPQEVSQKLKRLFGFLYLRALRTGSRALSLERGSLLDIILRRQGLQTGIWENAISRLRGLQPPIDEGATHLTPILENIEKRIAQYLHLDTDGRATQLFVSQLTREHLRKTISFFLKSNPGQEPVPFQEAGTGTLNILVLALLTFIGDIKKDNVIFAMEEPEIALPPHTQRRIVDYLLASTAQSFVTSHSPYVIERFELEQVGVLRRDKNGSVTVARIPDSSVLKPATYRRHLRRAFAEAILARGVIVCEGPTELDLLQATSALMEKHDPSKFYPLDLSGVTMMSVSGDGSLAEFGLTFRAMSIESFAFYDDNKKDVTHQKNQASFDIAFKSKHKGAETLITEEIPIKHLSSFLANLKSSGVAPVLAIPADEADLKALALGILKNHKGSGYAADVVGLCSFPELPATAVEFLSKIYERFKKPEVVPPIELNKDSGKGGGPEVLPAENVDWINTTAPEEAAPHKKAPPDEPPSNPA